MTIFVDCIKNRIMIKSRICEMLGITYPVFQGGMAWVADASLAAAVSNAGGLGLISSINAGTEAVRNEIRKCKELTDKPFGVNIMLQAPNAGEIAQMVVEEGVKILTTGAGSPAQYMPMWKEAGIKVIPVVASVALALKMQQAGADAVVAEGAESGGHVGELHTMPLVPQVVDAVDIPVVAAGGICDGRGAAAAFMLGADAIQVGTRFLSAEECNVHADYKEKILKATDISTIVTGKSLGHPVPSLKTPFSKTFARMESDPSVNQDDILAFGSGALRKAVQEGDRNGSYMAGECAGMVKKIEPAKDIVEDLILGAEKVIAETAARFRN
jgi:enoyl-[acyl-carrier protein] reductase II